MSSLKIEISTTFRDNGLVVSNGEYFYGREKEKRQLIDIVTNRSSASLLVGGIRGVGKTTFIKSVLTGLSLKKELNLEYAETNFSTSLNPENLPELVLKKLIRALYYSLKKSNKDILVDLRDLYEKTQYSNLSDGNSKEIIQYEAELQSKTKTLTLDISPFLIQGSLYIFTAYIIYSVNPICGILFSLLILLLSLVKPNIFYSSIKENKNSTQSKNQTTKSGKLDLSDDSMEIQLKNVLSQLKDNDHKIVFVLDELDKLSKRRGEMDHVKEIIEPLKNLFTLSNAIFIFIVDDTFFIKYLNERIDKPYEIDYTLFTDTLYIPILEYQDTCNLLENLVNTKIQASDQELFNRIKKYIAWESRNHIFDIHNILNKFIEYNEDGKTFLSLNTSNQIKKGNIPIDWDITVNLQNFIEAVYDEYKILHNYYYNERLYFALRYVSEELYNKHEVHVSINNYYSSLFEEKEFANLTEDQGKDIKGGIEYLLMITERLGLTNSEEIKRDEYLYLKYELSNDVSLIERKHISLKGEKLSFEMEFLKSYENFKLILENLSRIEPKLKILDPFNEEFGKLEKYIEPIIQEDKYNRLRKSEVERYKSKIDDLIHDLDIIFRKQVINYIKSKFSLETKDYKNLQAPLRNNLSIWDKEVSIKSFLLKYYESEIETYLLAKDDVRFIIGFDVPESLVMEYTTLNSKDKSKSNTNFINIITDNTQLPFSGVVGAWFNFKLDEDYKDVDKLLNKIEEKIKKYFPNNELDK